MKKYGTSEPIAVERDPEGKGIEPGELHVLAAQQGANGGTQLSMDDLADLYRENREVDG